jgi:hypothetical protein
MMAYTRNDDGSLTVDAVPRMSIGGTMLSALCGASAFSTPFKAECEMLGIYSEPENPAMILGRTMESHIIAEYERTYGKKVRIFPAIEGDYSSWLPHFTAEGGTFSAHVDGMTDNNSTIVEVKTTTKPALWVTDEGKPDVPWGYYIQASLYAWIANATKITYLVGIIDPRAYQTPEEVAEFQLMVLHVEPMHIADPDAFHDCLVRGRNAFDRLADTGTTRIPNLDNPHDRAVLRELFHAEADDIAIIAKLSRMESLKRDIDTLTASYDLLADDVKAVLSKRVEDGGKITVAVGSGSWTYRKDIRAKIDYKSACEDAKLDMSAYKTSSIVSVLGRDKPVSDKTSKPPKTAKTSKKDV